MRSAVRLELHQIHQSFGDNAVLKGVDLTVEPGRVTALVGENGAGKSTLTRVISGVHQPDGGRLVVDGHEAAFHGPQDAMARGIRVIYQEFRQNLFPHLDIASNLFVLDPTARFGRFPVRRAARRRAAREILDRVGLDVDPSRLVSSLGVAEQQQLVIAKAMSEDVRLLILDEPTAALDDAESELLFTQVARLRDQGVALVYISHRLKEVFALADEVVVLRDGQVALAAAPAETSEAEVVTAMAGRSVEDLYPRHSAPTERPRLELSGFSASGLVADLDLVVHEGEVVGIGGVAGSGKGEIPRGLFGLASTVDGEVRIDGEVVELSSPRRAIAAGVAYVSPDRQAEGLLLQQSVGANISLASLPDLAPRGVVRRGEERRVAGDMVTRLGIRTRSVDTEVGDLSGGNQQKVLFARWLRRRPRVLLLDEPTRGVDVAAKADIYRLIDEQTREGTAILLVSSDLPELVAMCDRVIVVRHGRAVAELSGPALTEESVLAHALESAS
ncbi:hypothetical protein ASF50_05315 [Nocardioides sp. Leaf307]|nr:hypothetical protein ASF50_05315 [Nocardioides sp. Leaf307]